MPLFVLLTKPLSLGTILKNSFYIMEATLINTQAIPRDLRELKEPNLEPETKKQISERLVVSIEALLFENTTGDLRRFLSDRYVCPFHSRSLKETNAREISKTIVSAISETSEVNETCFSSELVSEEIKISVKKNVEKKLRPFILMNTRNSGQRAFFCFTLQA